MEIAGLVVIILGVLWGIFIYFKPPKEKTIAKKSGLASEKEVRKWLTEESRIRLKKAIETIENNVPPLSVELCP